MHTLNLAAQNKTGRYAELLPQIAALTADEPDLTANLANTAAVLKEAFGWLWVGFYLVRGRELVLAPFQGPAACTRIPFGRGVCGRRLGRTRRRRGHAVRLRRRRRGRAGSRGAHPVRTPAGKRRVGTV